MKNRVITISREFGSGGRTIGKKVAEKLGIPCYDSELIQELEKQTGFAADYVKEAGEYAPGGFLASALSNRMFGPTNEDILWAQQYKVITALAEKGPCVIVGRCADYILQDKADCLKVFIHADMAFRAHRIVEVYGERDQSPEERLKDKDKRRAAYHRFYTDMKWGHAQNYHITLNSGVLGIDKCVSPPPPAAAEPADTLRREEFAALPPGVAHLAQVHPQAAAVLFLGMHQAHRQL